MTINRFMMLVDFAGAAVAASLFTLGETSLLLAVCGGVLLGSGIWRMVQEFEQ